VHGRHYLGEAKNIIQNTVYQILLESAKFYRRYDKNSLAYFFLIHGVHDHVKVN